MHMAEGRVRQEWNQTSSILALIATVNRDRKKRSRPFDPKEFHPLENAGQTRKDGFAVKSGDISILKQVFVKGDR